MTTQAAAPLMLNKQSVCERLALSPRTLEGMVKVNQFPKGIRLGKHVYWSESTLQRWTARMFGPQEAWTPFVAAKPAEKPAKVGKQARL